MRAAAIVRSAAELIGPSTWIQGISAREASGKLCLARDTRAAHWCIEGALLKFAGNIDADYETAADAVHAVCGGSFIKFNDARGRTAEEVKAALLRAARNLERRKSPSSEGVG